MSTHTDVLESEEEIEQLHSRHVQVKVYVSAELYRRVIPYPVIVERWDKIVTPRTGSSKKRAWLNEFAESERETLSRYYKKFRDWYLVSGTPDSILLNLRHFELLQRACNFFASH